MKTIKKGSKGQDVKTLQSYLNLRVDGIFGPLTEEAVIDFQKRNGLSQDGIVGPKTWEAMNVTEKTASRSINEIIVHCSATPEGRDVTVPEIRQWHFARGFTDIGYHYVIYLDGSINAGRPESISGAHCTGHNTHSIGVCYVGGYAKDGKTIKDTRTTAQKTSLTRLLKDLRKKYPGARIRSHRDFANKACPCFDATKEYASI